MRFQDRKDAAERLADALRPDLEPGAHVAGLPWDGLYVAAQVSLALKAPIGCLPVFKYALRPGRTDRHLAAVDPDHEVTLDPHTELRRYELVEYGRASIARLRKNAAACEGTCPDDLGGMAIIVVDDVVVDPWAAKAAAGYLRRHGAGSVTLATPVLPTSVREQLSGDFDRIVALDQPATYRGLETHYHDVGAMTEEQIAAAVQQAVRTCNLKA